MWPSWYGSKIEDNLKNSVDDIEFNMTEGVTTDMFGVSPSNNHEIMEVDVRGRVFNIRVLPPENQHICKSTGLILWESSQFTASVVSRFSKKGVGIGMWVWRHMFDGLGSIGRSCGPHRWR